MSDDAVDPRRRRFLTGTTVVIGGIGAAFTAVPFVSSFQPSARAKAIGAPVEVDISKLESGQRLVQKWRGKPVWVVRRTPEMVETLKSFDPATLRDANYDKSEQPEYAKNAWRSEKPEYLVLVGICTHLGCSPNYVPQAGAPEVGSTWKGGFFCPCHGSKFDLAGRVFDGVPAPSNMVVPPYRFLSDTKIMVGEDKGAAA
jgi:ubiquinol-cytochrome c reductase iron-sulfur subunit